MVTDALGLVEEVVDNSSPSPEGTRAAEASVTQDHYVGQEKTGACLSLFCSRHVKTFFVEEQNAWRHPYHRPPCCPPKHIVRFPFLYIFPGGRQHENRDPDAVLY